VSNTSALDLRDDRPLDALVVELLLFEQTPAFIGAAFNAFRQGFGNPA
jgi:hypothetical protein